MSNIEEEDGWVFDAGLAVLRLLGFDRMLSGTSSSTDGSAIGNGFAVAGTSEGSTLRLASAVRTFCRSSVLSKGKSRQNRRVLPCRQQKPEILKTSYMW